MSGTEITRAAVARINELKWIIELKNIKDKNYIYIKYERDIWILFWEDPLFFPQINMSFGLSNN